MLVLPSSTVPAARQRATTVASYGATKLDSIFDEHVVRMPSVQKMSLCATGTPVSGPPSPFASVSSAARASARARSAVTVTNALSSGPRRSMRPRKCSVRSRLENLRARRPAASSETVSVCMGRLRRKGWKNGDAHLISLSPFRRFRAVCHATGGEIGERPGSGTITVAASLDDLGHEVKSGGDARRVLLELLALIGL